ncbi:MAG: cyclic nucleotide-binding domain-containing protein [Gallionella sp.]|nr:cyclic nucleotide-binding domain-containing protein [Gallionella sp.]MDD4959129.1 cyclic nucleotide-binding domain-containing protein [Gallionella sp.]
MNETRVFVRTQLGQSELDKFDGNLSEDEKRLICLIDGLNSIADLRHKAPAGVRDDLGELLSHLLLKGFIIDIRQESKEKKIFIRTHPGDLALEQPDRNTSEGELYVLSLLDGRTNIADLRTKITSLTSYDVFDLVNKLLLKELIIEQTQAESIDKKEKMLKHANASQTLHLEMLLLAEVEVERRLEVEQELIALREKYAQSQSDLNKITSDYEGMRSKITLYRQEVEAKIAEQQAEIMAISGLNQGDRTQRMKLEADLIQLRLKMEMMQDMMGKQSAILDETIQQRLLLAQLAAQAERKQNKVNAESRVRTHPQYARVRGLDFFKKFRNSDLDELLSWSELIHVKENETIISEGEFGLTFYIVLSGKLLVLKDKHTIMMLSTGDSFGECSHFSESELLRDISVRSQSECELLLFEPVYLEKADLMLRMNLAESLVRTQVKRQRRMMKVMVKMFN